MATHTWRAVRANSPAKARRKAYGARVSLPQRLQEGRPSPRPRPQLRDGLWGRDTRAPQAPRPAVSPRALLGYQPPMTVFGRGQSAEFVAGLEGIASALQGAAR